MLTARGTLALWIEVALLVPPILAQTTTRVSVASDEAQGISESTLASISADGRFVAFMSSAQNFIVGDTNGFPDIFVRDRQLGTTSCVSLNWLGGLANGMSWSPAISADGRYVAFWSSAPTIVPGDTNQIWDVFVRDRLHGITTRASVATGGAQAQSNNQGSAHPAISAEGRHVAFTSDAANLVAGDTNGAPDIFVRDLQNGTTTRASVANGGVQSNGYSSYPSLSADGRYVAFKSVGSNLVAGDTNGFEDVFVHDRRSATTARVSVASGGAQADSYSELGLSDSISADGRYVVFTSLASNLVAGDTNGTFDVFLHDLQSVTTTRVSVATGGAQADRFSAGGSISPDGRYAAFSSGATNLVSGDTNASFDLFLHDRVSATTVRASVDAAGGQANSHSDTGRMSADGRYVVFHSGASNLVPGDTNDGRDVFVRDFAPSFGSFCFGDGSAGACPCGNIGAVGHGCEHSAGTGGALLAVSGTANPDTIVLGATGEPSSALTVFFQGSAAIGLASFGDGLRCTRGKLVRLYVKNASGGAVSAPGPGDPSIASLSASLGDPIPPGALRYYQAYYHDPDAGFCPNPPGDTWNVSNGVSVVW